MILVEIVVTIAGSEVTVDLADDHTSSVTVNGNDYKLHNELNK